MSVETSLIVYAHRHATTILFELNTPKVSKTIVHFYHLTAITPKQRYSVAGGFIVWFPPWVPGARNQVRT